MKTIRILNLGAGVQSTTIALMGLKNWEYWSCSEPLPYPSVGLIDYAIFADTQEEPFRVYEHLGWLEKEIAKFIKVLRVTKGKLGDALTVADEGQRGSMTGIPAFLATAEGLKEGIAIRRCTRDYKIDPIRKEIRKLFGKDAHLRLYGLSYDEPGRIALVKAREPEALFPLFEMEMTRGGCLSWLRRHYPTHEVPRSACVFCPYHSNQEWRNIRDNDPQGWARALEIDACLRDGKSIVQRTWQKSLYLHSDCVPLEQVDLDDPETKERRKGQAMFGFLQECEGMCGV